MRWLSSISRPSHAAWGIVNMISKYLALPNTTIDAQTGQIALRAFMTMGLASSI
jgi:hypothetical protein